MVHPAHPNTYPYVTWPDAFTDAELDAIIAYGERLEMVRSRVPNPNQEEAARVRKSHNAWIERMSDIEWLYARMESLSQSINAEVYQFDLVGFSEPFQYAVYRSEERSHFDWHVDQGPIAVHRKLSFTLQLSSPTDYEGGELEFYVRDTVDVAPKDRGALVAFPSYTMHRVTPVTGGVRRSLVAWTRGPRFR